MPSTCLLLGAGFSRNWGGWLAQELHGELLSQVQNIPSLYQRLLATRNFEELLYELQVAARSGGQSHRSDLSAMETAIQFVFWEMDHYFSRLQGMEFSGLVENSILRFMARFDRIFTLNQDMFLELHYNIEDTEKWSGRSFPGLRVPHGWRSHPITDKLRVAWFPQPEISEERNHQPIYKLHGSAFWRESAGDALMVMGGGKAEAIERSQLLRRYSEVFRENLCAGDSRLMVVGYSFQDAHINKIIQEASENCGLRIYLIDPRGWGLFDAPPEQQIKPLNPLRSLRFVGISTRTLKDTFSIDELQRRSLERFLN